MNRGRHKKSKEKKFNTQSEILNAIQKELYILLAVYRDQKTYSMKDYFAKACISSNDGKNYYGIVAWYITSDYYIDNFLNKVKTALNEETIKGSKYLIKFEYGRNSKIFKYKHE